ncbi:MAG: Asp23/Gls24 family envelope stress response protein [Clostridiales Family XIII bacterium]|jgi:uncharacterized alkaline shock family protein YloU|nr:Asp23/Gls24 family envelope stress response protein [Clostridiales Family XIII bacterium]
MGNEKNEKENNKENGYGEVRIASEVIAAYVSEAASSVEGVFGLGGNLSAAALTSKVLGRENKIRGVRVSEDENDGYSIDIFLVVEFGTKIPEVAWNVQKRVTEGLARTADIKIKGVNIHVQGVHSGDSQTA